MDCAERIRDLREDRDWSQKQVADILQIRQTTYSDYEHRRIRIPVDSLILLAKAYDVDLNYICGISKEKKPYPKK
ncbi:MAG: helix-turn-helix domain-containing protein [Oscillospiraceae bacterium]|nr:helix-turn-helix domain-containing protein [Oscillospiraceae bacterium]